MRRFLQLRGHVAVMQGAQQLEGPDMEVGEVTGSASSCFATDIMRHMLMLVISRKGLVLWL